MNVYLNNSIKVVAAAGISAGVGFLAGGGVGALFTGALSGSYYLVRVLIPYGNKPEFKGESDKSDYEFGLIASATARVFLSMIVSALAMGNSRYRGTLLPRSVVWCGIASLVMIEIFSRFLEK